jgi:hypothetical protein
VALLHGAQYESCTGWRPRTPPGWVPPVPHRPVGSQVDAGLVGTASAQSRITAGAAGPSALQSPTVPARPPRHLPAGAMLLPGVDHSIPQKARRRDYRRNHEGKGQESGQALRTGQGYDPHHGERGEHAYPRPPGPFCQRPGGRAGWPGRGRLSGGWPGVEIADDRGQFGICPRRERVVHPEVKLVFGQPVFYERGLEYLDRLLAVGLRRAEPSAARRPCRYLVSRPCLHSDSPNVMQQSVTPSQSPGYPAGG